MKKTEESASGSTGPSRRAVVSAAAWSVPVLAVAVATPAAAASGEPDAWNVALHANSGETLTWFNAAANPTRYNEYDSPNIPRLSSTGPTDVPAGRSYVLIWDDRIYGDLTVTGGALLLTTEGTTVTTLTGGVDYIAGASVTVGHQVTTIITTNIAIPVGQELRFDYLRPFVSGLLTDNIVYTDLVPLSFEVSSGPGETDVSDNEIHNVPIEAPVP